MIDPDPMHEQCGYEVSSSEPKELPPSIVRDVQAAGHCAECGKSLATQKTITVHAGKPYCACCFNPGAGS